MLMASTWRSRLIIANCFSFFLPPATGEMEMRGDYGNRFTAQLDCEPRFRRHSIKNSFVNVTWRGKQIAKEAEETSVVGKPLQRSTKTRNFLQHKPELWWSKCRINSLKNPFLRSSASSYHRAHSRAT